ncbi:MAG: AMP-binding protein, partial [Pseudomonadota bacterium]|nr:AMP-binding protein [Pseudomonadota bacterium]
MVEAAGAGEPHILRYTRWLREHRGLDFDPTTHAGYDRLWRWSCDDLEAFWQSIWDYFEVRSPTPHARVLKAEVMPGARWFEGARVNYAGHVFAHRERADAAGVPAIVFRDESLQDLGQSEVIGWLELQRRVASFAQSLRELGVEPGDRVAAFLPNVPATAVAFLATASIGAIWSVCSADMGPLAVLDRFRQIEPKVLVATRRYRYGGIVHDRSAVLAEMLAELPSIRAVVLVGDEAPREADLDVGPRAPTLHAYADLIAADVAFAPTPVDFDHPLWIVYS